MSGPTLESLRAEGADCHDPVRYRYLQAMAERLPLQPIVENAIKHGTSQHLGVGEITIRASQDDRWLQLDIEDNAGLYRANPQASGLGMNLVDRRLRARFGADCGISVTCEPERFTRVTLRLPLEENAC